MKLVNAQVENFRSIDNSTSVTIDPKVTVLVGQNESGKTGFLQALNFCRPVEPNGGFDLDREMVARLARRPLLVAVTGVHG